MTHFIMKLMIVMSFWLGLDRFSGFVSEIDNIAKALEAASVSCENARRKLSTGRGNLVGRAQQLQALGAHSGKTMGGKTMGGKTMGGKSKGSKSLSDNVTARNSVAGKTLSE